MATTITYGGNTIASLSSGEAFTSSSLAGKVASTNIVVTANGASGEKTTVTYNGNTLFDQQSGTFTMPTAGKIVPYEFAVEYSGSTPTVNPYITFFSPNTFTLSVVDNQKYWDGTIEYSTDTTNWSIWSGTSAISSSQSGTTKYLYVRGSNNTYITGINASATTKAWRPNGTNISISGNISKLLNYSGTSNPATYAFSSWFRYSDASATGNTSITDASGLVIDIDNVNYIFQYAFYYNIGLVTAPQLPSTTSANYCYRSMFYGCTSLTTAPALPATTLATRCYYHMFYGCTSLTTAPALPATTLATYCYYYMFYGCTSLTTAPALPATTLTINCYNSMFYGCSKIKVSTSQTGGYQTPYRIPTSGTGTTATNALNNMFASTGGSFTGTPTINTTYYTSNTIVS